MRSGLDNVSFAEEPLTIEVKAAPEIEVLFEPGIKVFDFEENSASIFVISFECVLSALISTAIKTSESLKDISFSNSFKEDSIFPSEYVFVIFISNGYFSFS